MGSILQVNSPYLNIMGSRYQAWLGLEQLLYMAVHHRDECNSLHPSCHRGPFLAITALGNLFSLSARCLKTLNCSKIPNILNSDKMLCVGNTHSHDVASPSECRCAKKQMKSAFWDWREAQ